MSQQYSIASGQKYRTSSSEAGEMRASMGAVRSGMSSLYKSCYVENHRYSTIAGGMSLSGRKRNNMQRIYSYRNENTRRRRAGNGYDFVRAGIKARRHEAKPREAKSEAAYGLAFT